MKYLNRLATVFCSAALGLLTLTGCEGGDLYGIDAPGWIAAEVDSIAAAKAASQGGEEEIEGLHEDVYNIGKEDLTSGFWTLGKTYVVPAGGKWQAQFNLKVNPDNVYYKNCYIVFNDYNPDTDDHLGTEYGVIRFDNDPTKNSEWGDNIDRSLVKANFENSSNNDAETDASVQKMNGKVTITVDRTEGGVHYTIANGELTKEYIQPYDFPMKNSEGKICCRIGVEKAIVNFLGSTIEPIGGYTSKEDKLPLSMTLNGVPKKVKLGTELAEAFANVTATIQFEQGVTKDVPASELSFQAVPDMNSLGTKTLMAAYNKSYKGEVISKSVMAMASFDVVDKLYTSIGNTDNSTAFWGAHSENFKVGPKESFVTSFTNYTNGQNNWNNFVVVLCSSDGSKEYAVVRADNYGWGDGYAACTPSGGQSDWGAWLKAMDGAKVTVAVTNNGDGTADIQCVMIGNDGNTYIQNYTGINNVDPNNCYFNLTVDGSHIEFDDVIGAEDNSTAFWGAHSQMLRVPLGQSVTTRIKNFTNLQNNWNNFVVVLTREDNTEYAVVRADNYGWGDSYGACKPSGGQSDWAAWLKAMDEAMCYVSVTNNGSSADVKCIMIGNDGKTYKQDYIGISPVDGEDLFFRLTVDGSHLIFE